MNVLKFSSSLLILLLAFTSCTDDGLISSESTGPTFNSNFPNVQEELWPYFESFERQAATQGLTIDLVEENIKGSIMPIDEANVAGVCTYGGFSPGEIVIDSEFWSRANYYAKEMIVFHELGHCFLFRDHLEGRNPNGTCVSIMRSGLERCRDNYNAISKSHYVEELFSINNRQF